MQTKDPFNFKKLPKTSLRRIAFVAGARIAELQAKRKFAKYAMPLINGQEDAICSSSFDTADTAVTLPQMTLLEYCLRTTEALDVPIVEVGAYRGVTTACLASSTARSYFAVDPYIGYGGAETDMLQMAKRVAPLKNVSHLRTTSGEAAGSGEIRSASFVFVDAVHDYVNASFDGAVWGAKLVVSGLLAFHDTDNIHFAGVQRAVWELVNGKSKLRLTLFAHVDGLVVLRKE